MELGEKERRTARQEGAQHKVHVFGCVRRKDVWPQLAHTAEDLDEGRQVGPVQCLAATHPVHELLAEAVEQAGGLVMGQHLDHSPVLCGHISLTCSIRLRHMVRMVSASTAKICQLHVSRLSCRHLEHFLLAMQSKIQGFEPSGCSS